MVKRQLTEIEKKFINQNLLTLMSDAEYIEKVQIPQKQFTLDTADIVIKKQKKDVELEMKIFKSRLEELNSTIDILRKQLREGVDVKENKKEKGGNK